MDIKRFYQVLTVLFVIVFYAGKTRAEILEDKEYQYDNAGNIAGITDRINGSQGFQYDEQNRLKSASGNDYNEKYEYTKTGNMISKGGKRYRYPAAGQRQPHAPTSDGVYEYTYTKKGNLKTKTKYDGEKWEYFYDYESHLKKVTKNGVVLGEYLYDYAGRLVKKSEEGHETLYFNDMYEERDGVPYTFYYANGERVAERVGTGPNSKLYYYHNDHLGGTNIITDEEGKVVKKVQYFPFGKTRLETGTKDAPYKFTGKEFSSSTGLYYYGARWYDPDLGRFITPDPIISNYANSQALNRYSYVYNNPLRYTDPSGHCPFCFIAVGAVIGAGTNSMTAALSGQNVGMAAMTGAAGGAIMGGGAWFGGPLAMAAAGAGSGATTSAISGSDIGMGAGVGAGFGLAASIAPNPIPLSETNPYLNIAGQIGNDAIKGAAISSAFAAAQGQDVGQAAMYGAASWAAGGLATNMIGHGYGYLMSGSGPTFKNGAWVYSNNTAQPVTLGSVIVGQKGWLDSPAYAGTIDTGKTVLQHEMAHINQRNVLGPIYLPAHVLSLGVGGLIGMGTGVGFQAGTHSYNILERYWIDVPNY